VVRYENSQGWPALGAAHRIAVLRADSSARELCDVRSRTWHLAHWDIGR
jgi:hypothetical protein